MYHPLFPAQVSGEGAELMLSMRGLKKCCETLPSSQGMTTEQHKLTAAVVTCTRPSQDSSIGGGGAVSPHPNGAIYL